MHFFFLIDVLRGTVLAWERFLALVMDMNRVVIGCVNDGCGLVMLCVV